MADSKEDTIRRGYKAFGEGDMETMRSIYTADVVQSQPGDNQLSGEHTGSTTSLGSTGNCSSCRAGPSS
jgi:ketosteroid isomerase-like protein